MNRWISRGMGDSWKLLLSSLHTAKFWVRVSRHPSKFLNGRHKQRRGQHTLARQQKYKKLTLSVSVSVSVDGSWGRRVWVLLWSCDNEASVLRRPVLHFTSILCAFLSEWVFMMSSHLFRHSHPMIPPISPFQSLLFQTLRSRPIVWTELRAMCIVHHTHFRTYIARTYKKKEQVYDGVSVHFFN
jgi:hypothetical protein